MHLFTSHKDHKKGFTIMEVIIASTIISVSIGAILVTYNTYFKAAVGNTPSIQATLLAEEGIEASKAMRDAGWATYIQGLSTTTNYYLYYNTSTNLWRATTTASSIDSTFKRTVTFQNAYRDGSDNIVTSGGTIDTNTRLVTVSVAWSNKGSTTTKALATYISNLYNN